jgi:hypothetical protein
MLALPVLCIHSLSDQTTSAQSNLRTTVDVDVRCNPNQAPRAVYPLIQSVPADLSISKHVWEHIAYMTLASPLCRRRSPSLSVGSLTSMTKLFLSSWFQNRTSFRGMEQSASQECHERASQTRLNAEQEAPFFTLKKMILRKNGTFHQPVAFFRNIVSLGLGKYDSDES